MPLHVEPDQLLLSSHSFWQVNHQILDQLSLLRSDLMRLQMTWNSDQADKFMEEMDQIIQQLNSQAEELFKLGLTLSHQADLWAETDQRWAGIFRDQIGT